MRLIDADALIQKRNHAKAYAPDMYVIGQGYVMDAPAIDAVEVVRCKECRHYDHGCCVVMRYKDDHHIIGVKPTDYCSYGERKESEGST